MYGTLVNSNYVRDYMKQAKKILVVEDQLLVALDIENQLESFGYASVNNATNYLQAVQRINENPPDLILLDIILKDGPTGFNIAKVANEKKIPVVFVTASTHKSYLERAKKLHPKAILNKPLNESKLRETVERIMG